MTITNRPTGTASPQNFLGLSFEMRSLPTIAGYATHPADSDFVALLRSLGPGVLRFGGISADTEAAWVGDRGALPRWARVAVTRQDFAQLAELARATGWQVLLTVNLGHYDPTAAAREATAAQATLGPYLAGVAIGNEPDRYVLKHLRAPGYDFAAYRAQAAAYRAAIVRAAPGVPIVGPDASSGTPGLAWMQASARTLRPALLSDHYYPLSSCGYSPTISELLSPLTMGKESALLARAVAIARAARTPLRIDELGSISCEGYAGVSDTFAAALWALEYIARALAAGVAGVDFHDLPTRPRAYSPLIAPTPAALTSGELQAAPAWYALLAARELPGSRPLASSVAAGAPGALGASSFGAPDGRLRVVLVDYDPPGSPPLLVKLRGVCARACAHARAHSNEFSTFAAGSVVRLTAASPAARTGVRLAGHTVAADGSWSAPTSLPALYERAGAFSLQLRPSSAAIVTLYPSRPPKAAASG